MTSYRPAHHRQVAPPAAFDTTLRRLSTLMRMAEGAWALAVADDPATQRRAMRRLEAEVAPLPVLERSLDTPTPDPLPMLRAVDQESALVSFTDVDRALPDLYGYLDLQRDTLAKQPHRLLVWATPATARRLARHAPNFMSRLSGIFDFSRTPLPHADRLRAPLPVRR